MKIRVGLHGAREPYLRRFLDTQARAIVRERAHDVEILVIGIHGQFVPGSLCIALKTCDYCPLECETPLVISLFCSSAQPNGIRRLVLRTVSRIPSIARNQERALIQFLAESTSIEVCVSKPKPRTNPIDHDTLQRFSSGAPQDLLRARIVSKRSTEIEVRRCMWHV